MIDIWNSNVIINVRNFYKVVVEYNQDDLTYNFGYYFCNDQYLLSEVDTQ